jgi:hypothetical protein
LAGARVFARMVWTHVSWVEWMLLIDDVSVGEHLFTADDMNELPLENEGDDAGCDAAVAGSMEQIFNCFKKATIKLGAFTSSCLWLSVSEGRWKPLTGGPDLLRALIHFLQQLRRTCWPTIASPTLPDSAKLYSRALFTRKS